MYIRRVLAFRDLPYGQGSGFGPLMQAIGRSVASRGSSAACKRSCQAWAPEKGGCLGSLFQGWLDCESGGRILPRMEAAGGQMAPTRTAPLLVQA